MLSPMVFVCVVHCAFSYILAGCSLLDIFMCFKLVSVLIYSSLVVIVFAF